MISIIAKLIAIISLLLIPFGLAWSGVLSRALGRRISRLRLFAILFAVFLISSAIAIFTETESPQNSARQTANAPGYFKVTGVIDGDTLRVDIVGKVETVRLIGIDAPEIPGGCFAKESAIHARQVLSGKSVRLKPDPTQANRDTYGRLLRYIILPDGTDFNRLMISEGYAREYTFKSPYRHQASFKLAEQTARASQSGLWLPDACNA